MGRYSTKFLFCFKISPNFLYVGDAFRVKLTGLRSDYINASHFNYTSDRLMTEHRGIIMAVVIALKLSVDELCVGTVTDTAGNGFY